MQVIEDAVRAAYGLRDGLRRSRAVIGGQGCPPRYLTMGHTLAAKVSDVGVPSQKDALPPSLQPYSPETSRPISRTSCALPDREQAGNLQMAGGLCLIIAGFEVSTPTAVSTLAGRQRSTARRPCPIKPPYFPVRLRR
ncbi:hypothetical protein VTK56DRAFT_39 [Thermocarpiscus australiensis]